MKMADSGILSIVVPLYRSEENLPRLFQELERISRLCPAPLEIVFVVDGSPDRCAEIVRGKLSEFPVAAQLLELSRNFGAFAAISAGLQHARGEYFAVLAADLQEPPELALQFLEKMKAGADLVFGQRVNRSDPAFSLVASYLFWSVYRRLVNPQIPPGGVDVFGCNRKVRDQVCSMKEVETSLVGLLFWLGFKREFVPYERRVRLEGKSAWTLSKKIRYLVNSIFNFTDLPIRLLLGIGVFISTMTSNQIIAGGVTFFVCLLLWLLSWFTAFDSSATGQVVNYISIVPHFENFAKGVLESKDVIFFGLFLTSRSMESLRWRA